MAFVALLLSLAVGPVPAAGSVLLWNSPFPQACRSATRARSAAYFREFGVTANAHAAFNGDEISTIYCPNKINGRNFSFGLWPHYDPVTGAAVHGGIPQRGNLTAHLASVAYAIESMFPNVDHDGVVVIDWEMWYPWLIPESHSIYVNESIHYANGDVALAVEQWNTTSLRYMEETMKLAVRMRPNASWGYYGRPGCYTGWRNLSQPPGCIVSVERRNNALSSLWEAQTALFPSVYIGTNPKYGNRTRTPRYVADEITETLRVKRRMKKGDNVKVYAFVWYDVFSPPCAQYENCTQIFSSQDFQTEFHSPLQEGVDGLVIWGSSGDVNSAAKCANMETYVGGVLGPFLKNLTQNL